MAVEDPAAAGSVPVPVSRSVRIAAIVAVIAVPVIQTILGLKGMIDLKVYRDGGSAWIHGIGLYGPDFHAPIGLPFTYPPFAAVSFSLLSAAPWVIASFAVLALGMAALTATMRLALDHLAPVRYRSWYYAALAAVTGAAFEPVRETLKYGQVNLILMGLIAVDCLAPRTKWPRGVLVGLAAAFKLTPAVFILYFIVKRQWRPVITTAVTFVSVGLFAAAVAPSDSKDYWTSVIFDPARIGPIGLASNQSLRGVLHRFSLSSGVEQAWWLGLSVVVVVIAFIAASRAHKAGDELGSLLVVAVAELLISPISWSHHWVWIVPGAYYVAARLGASLRGRIAAAGGVIFFVISPHWWFPRKHDRELRWGWWEHLLGDSYVIVGLLFLLLGALGRFPYGGPPAEPAEVQAPDRAADAVAAGG